MEGKVLGNRYELLEKIGGGGMALVYKAKCKLLNRFVAVKILRPEFTNDEEFVKRFRIEAQSAASLSHPNIVSIYDVGHEENIHYIVMEYVDGVTLKDYIVEKGALSWREAVNIAIQVCAAIEHAHKNHIVHRDIKPHNILLTKDGIAKVTDFGIARAVSSSTITMVGSTIGSVHYFSPEQARGGYIDEKSDLYSLGIALYEMVTGRLPFDGETPVAIALKHLQVEAQPPVELQKNVPSAVNDIIVKAIKKDQHQRYQTASDMLGDLYRSLKEPYGQFVEEEGSAKESPTKKIQAISAENLVRKGAYTKAEAEPEKPAKKGDRLTVVLAVVTSAIIISIFAYIGYNFVIPAISVDTKEFEVKSYVNKNYDEVKEELNKAGIEANDKRKYDDKIPKDTIISQNIDAGKKLRLGVYNIIQFEVSDGPHLIKIPDFRKIDNREAEIKLEQMGLLTRTEEEYDDTIPINFVTRTDPPADTEVKPDMVVTIYKSKGPQQKPTKVPNLIGKTLADAQKALGDAKLVIGKMYPEDSKNFVDKIIRQEPLPDTQANEGAPVNIYFDGNTGTKKDEVINLSNPEKYGDKIKVLVVVTPSDTNQDTIFMNEEKNKKDFPLTLSIPVPENGKTRVRVYLDDTLYVDLTK